MLQTYRNDIGIMNTAWLENNYAQKIFLSEHDQKVLTINSK